MLKLEIKALREIKALQEILALTVLQETPDPQETLE
jgi:hypothetical protein